MSKINFAMFMAGLTIGSAATWLCLKKRYEQIAQEEIDSVKAVFAEKKPETVIRKEENLDKDNKIKANQAKLKPDLINYATKLAEEGYTNYAATNNKNVKEEKVNMVEKPYVISPEEFGDFDEYTKLSLTYYSDGVLADENDEIVDDIDETVGADFADHFGEYEDDSVFVRNDRLKCDYEILRDNRSYSDVTGPRSDGGLNDRERAEQRIF